MYNSFRQLVSIKTIAYFFPNFILNRLIDDATKTAASIQLKSVTKKKGKSRKNNIDHDYSVDYEADNDDDHISKSSNLPDMLPQIVGNQKYPDFYESNNSSFIEDVGEEVCLQIIVSKMLIISRYLFLLTSHTLCYIILFYPIIYYNHIILFYLI